MEVIPGGGATQVWFGQGRAVDTWKVDPFLPEPQILS